MSQQAWYRDLNRYHWFVVIVASVGWMFDTMAQQLFNLARVPAIRDLLGGSASPATISEQAGYSTMVFMIGWALGGILFGVLGDRLGRAKTMMLTILCYTIFTGLSLLSVGVWDFNAYRFLCGLGVGGQFAVGVALVAEVVPSNARPHALGHGASRVRYRQHARGAHRHCARQDGKLGRDRACLAILVPGRSASRAACADRL